MRRLFGVVVAFVALVFLACLILPSILRARTSADRRICSNNLKQLGLALHNYHDVYKSFPPGTVANQALQPEDRLSWLIPLFPYLEQDNVYRSLDLYKAWNAPENYLLGNGSIYNCLSCSESYTSIIGSYIGVAGLGSDAATLPLGDSKAGVFGYDRRTKLSDVLDGNSKTLMVIETNFQNGPWAAGGFPTVR